MKTAERIEANRIAAKFQYNGNVVLNALYEVYGDLEVAHAKYESCLTSRRFAVLLSIASHGQSQFGRLKIAAVKIANNPATRAHI